MALDSGHVKCATVQEKYKLRGRCAVPEPEKRSTVSTRENVNVDLEQLRNGQVLLPLLLDKVGVRLDAGWGDGLKSPRRDAFHQNADEGGDDV